MSFDMPPDRDIHDECRYMIERLRDALTMMYDKWENGVHSYENPEDYEGFIGHAFKLTVKEENEILALIPREHKGPGENNV